MSAHEPPLKYKDTAVAASITPSKLDSQADDSVALLYMLDTSSDRALEIDPNDIPIGPDDGPTWAQHDFSDIVALQQKQPVQPNPSESAARAEEVAAALNDLIHTDIPRAPPKDRAERQSANVKPYPDDSGDLCSSIDSELANLY